MPNYTKHREIDTPELRTGTLTERVSGAGIDVDGTTVKDGGATLKDDVTWFVDPAAPTKRVRLDAGAVTAGQTRTISAPDANVDLADLVTLAGAGAQALDAAASPTFAGLKLTGDLVVEGETIQVDAESVLLRSNYLLANVDYTTVAAQAGGIVVNYLPTATADNTVGAGVVVAGVDGVSDPTITTAGEATFAATDIVQISGSANDGENDGIYEVQGHAAFTLTLKSTSNGVSNRVEGFTRDQLVANAGDVGMTITKIGVAVIRAGTDGAWEVAVGNQTGLVFTDLALKSVTDALGAENTDGAMQIPLLGGIADGGTWTLACSSGGLVTATRTAADAADSFWVEIPAPNRTTASKGIKPTGLRVNYSVNTADAADVRFEVWKVTQGADGSARTAAVLFGEDDADYDADHNTTVKRGDDSGGPELHLAVVTDAGAPAYLAAGESLLLRCYVDGDAGPASIVVVTSAQLLYSETLVDLA